MTTRKKRLLWLLVVAIALFTGARVYFRLTDDFRVSNIMYEIPFHPEWENAPLSKAEQSQLDAILSQPFYYIGKGAQSYVFASEDQKFVLKFFKFKHLKPSPLAQLLPPIPPFKSYRDQIALRKQKKLDSVFAGYKLAYDRHRSESGLVYIQLNPSHQHKTVRLYDKLGFERRVDLGSVVFVVQEKGQTTRTTLTELLAENDIGKVKKRINQIIDLYLSEYDKGIYDRDHGVMHNTGFVGEKPIHLDIGKLTDDPTIRDPARVREDLLKVAAKIELWLRKNYPDAYAEIVPDLEKRLSVIFGEPFHFHS